ncbi:A/G-specific adenine glycosylase [Terriglobus tenax]|uniref:A/G-specific adenine glycosylase n=1 Tax=Terriglobus tenax TaxID=1111115 RepID=UPI0021DFFAD3|nr:A/G-specific adenine glycosylase [Terriglobus tenax]
MPNAGFPPEQVAGFRRALSKWYQQHARVLPWRETGDPYHIWVSEVMLQQTRVNAVLEHYDRFLRRFPTLVSLALAPEEDVLAVWSGLGYYRRARMLHKAAQFITAELDGRLPSTSQELRKLPGIGDYTSAAIASIAFGESIAVVDGNVERVLLRITGRAEEATAEAKRFVAAQAAALVPAANRAQNAPGDHNQAMMELGATICVPRGPLCLQCPVHDFCLTRGEHKTEAREKMRSRRVAYLLHQRKREGVIEVMLHRRPAEASLMPGMYELPELPGESVAGYTATLQVRHSITNTNYYVEVFSADQALVGQLPLSLRDYEWWRLGTLPDLPLTGLARKALRRLHLIASPGVRMPQPEAVVRQ